MAQQPLTNKPTTPVGREAGLHSEITMYHPTAEEHSEVDKAVSSVPSVKRYVIGFLIAAAAIGVALFFLLR
jgi:hypothetical protein